MPWTDGMEHTMPHNVDPPDESSATSDLLTTLLTRRINESCVASPHADAPVLLSRDEARALRDRLLPMRIPVPPNHPQAAEREHAPVPVPNVTVALEFGTYVAHEAGEWHIAGHGMRVSPDMASALSRIHEQDTELVKLRAEVARLQALEQYVEHDLDCPQHPMPVVQSDWNKPCTCGLDDVLGPMPDSSDTPPNVSPEAPHE